MTIEFAIAQLNINKEADVTVSQMKSILTTDELVSEYICRLSSFSGNREIAINRVLYMMREEILKESLMSVELFL